ncbi:MAG: hypothetical protein COX07_05960 [Bacteroidetes bacterium CG23_combo_of_CG06-09_8_20_14_all_32_9]|nr:MAG: hypothetical protein COX07_05960 [Bacteroidetes bacterium CG23_combo_of_CG06-09_8_20_14_all_32_9]
MKPVKFYNVDRFYQLNKDKIIELANEVFSTGQVLEGIYVTKTEKKLAQLTNRKYAVTVNSCTDALFFSLIASGIKYGDEVLVPAFSFIASASAIIRTGATPVFVDVNDDGLINFEKAAKKITQRTKAIVAVHLFGKMANPETLNSFSKQFNLTIIEDAAQALGSRHTEIPAGNTGLASCFSFDPSKIVNAFGTGGVIVTDNEEIAGKAKSMRVHGKSANVNNFEILGCNSRIPSLQAAILHFQLLQIKDITSKRNNVANYYYSKLSNIHNLRFLIPSQDELWNYHKFPIFTSFRDKLKDYLSKNNIETGIHYSKTLPEYSVFGKSEISYPVAEMLSKTELSLPIYPELNEEELSWICDCINKFYITQHT